MHITSPRAIAWERPDQTRGRTKKKKMKPLFLYRIVTILVIICLALKVNGQTERPATEISGTIIDSLTRSPLPHITITLKKPNANQPVKVAVSKTDGHFSFSAPEFTQYQVIVTAVSYRDKVILLDLTDTAKQNEDIGIIYITKKIKTLEEVNVTATRPIIKQEADRIIYDLQADPDSRSNSVLEMMRKVPFLSLDANNNIRLRGNSSFRIFINGKPSGMLTNNPKEILSSMPASTIKSIEVITNPPSKYDAEGLAGIINIILIKKVDNGINGTINLKGSFPQGGPGIGGSIAVKQGKLGISAYGGASINNMPEIMTSSHRNSFNLKPVELAQEGTNESDNRSGYVGTEISYEIDSLHLVYATFNTYANRTDGNNSRHSSLISGGQLLEGYRFANKSRNTGKGMDAGLNYQIGFKADKNRLLTFSYNYRNNISDLTNDVIIDNRVNYTLPEYRQFNEGRASEQTAQVDYIHPLKNVVIEAGVKGIFRANKSDYQYYYLNAVSEIFEMDSSASNYFRNNQNVFGIYNSYNFTIRNWNIKAGARLEQTVTDADFISTDTKVRQNLFHLIPTLAIGYKLNDKNSFNLGFNRRIKRPGIYKLNPYVNRSNPNFESTGNPDLEPSLVNNLMLGYGKSGKLNINIGLGYAFFNNMDLGITAFDSARNVTISTFRNIGKGVAYVSDINIGYPLTKRWYAGLNSNLTYVRIKGESAGSEREINSLLYNIGLSSNYKFNSGWRFIANATAIGPNVVSLQAISNAMFTTSFSVSKNLFQEKLSLSAAINNPFTTYRKNRVETTGFDFSEVNITREYFRNFSVNLNLRLGKSKDAVKKNKRGINNNDLSNSKGGL